MVTLITLIGKKNILGPQGCMPLSFICLVSRLKGSFISENMILRRLQPQQNSADPDSSNPGEIFDVRPEPHPEFCIGILLRCHSACSRVFYIWFTK